MLSSKTGQRWIVNLLQRLDLHGDGDEVLQPYQELRVACMTPVGRAALRRKVAFLMSRVADLDEQPLRDLGLNGMGLAPEVPEGPRPS